ncbi:MAG: hypothetical protein ACLGSA_12470 [Acidobacteriota bacterium]
MASRKAFLTPWNYVDADPYAGIAPAVYSGPEGDWLESGDMTLDNLHSRFMLRVSRSSGTTASLFVVLDEPRLIQCVGVMGHNMSGQARVQVVGYDDAGMTIEHAGANTGNQPVWPRYVPSGMLPFEARNWWTGQPTAEDLARVPRSWFTLLDQPRYTKYWGFHFSDPNNPAGYIDISRVILAPIIQFSVNFTYGSTFGWGSRSTASYSLGGVKFSNYVPPYRVAALNIEHLLQDESFALLRAQSRRGTDRAAFMCLDPGDSQNRQVYSFMSYFNELVPMIFSSPNRRSFGTINFEEAL